MGEQKKCKQQRCGLNKRNIQNNNRRIRRTGKPERSGRHNQYGMGEREDIEAIYMWSESKKYEEQDKPKHIEELGEIDEVEDIEEIYGMEEIELLEEIGALELCSRQKN